MNVAASTPRPPRTLLAPLLAGWFTVAVALSAARLIVGHPALVAFALVAQVSLALVAYRRLPTLRAAIDAIELRWLVSFHAVRAPIGAAFLVLMSQGMLSPTFALRGGVGDLLAGALALVAARLLHRRRLVLAWNTYGLFDIVLTVATGQKLALIDRDPAMLGAFGLAPFGMLPFFVVPLVVLTHLAVFARLRAR